MTMHETLAGELNEWRVARGRAPCWFSGYTSEIAEAGVTGIRVHRHSPHQFYTVCYGSVSEGGSELDAVVRALHEKLMGLKERSATWEGRLLHPEWLLRAFALEEAAHA
jgi:hypothetical protein